jgi:uncharacterized membrane protein YgaE (UPF0421/DUF939 family)
LTVSVVEVGLKQVRQAMTEENRDILGQLAIIGVVVAAVAIYAAMYDAWDRFIYIVVAMGVAAVIYLFWVIPIQKQLQSIEDKIDDLRGR